MEILSVDDVLLINRKVVEDARQSADPIATMIGSGVSSRLKDHRLLESAVGRQIAGTNGQLIYATPQLNAATLMFGIAKNHAFYDGNKRTALVAMLNHLDRNHITISDVNWKEVEKVVLDLVLGLLPNDPKLRQACAGAVDRHEKNVRALAEWIRQHSRRLERSERRMTFDELNQVLRQHGFELGNPSGNFISVYKVMLEERKSFFGKPRTERRLQHIGSIGYPGGKREVAIFGIKHVRRLCRLTEEHGVDSACFYDREAALDEIINNNRRVLRRLASK